MDYKIISERFKEFVDNNYKGELLKNASSGKNYLIVDFVKLSKFDSALAEELMDNPDDVLSIMGGTLSNYDDDIPPDIKVGIKNLKGGSIYINKNRKENLYHLVSLRGMLSSRTEVFPRIIASVFECSSCGESKEIKQDEEIYKTPSICSCGRKGKLKKVKDVFDDCIKIMVEELPENLTGAEQPAKIRGTLFNYLCNDDHNLYLGARINAVGILKEVQESSKNYKKLNCSYDLLIIYYENMDNILFDAKETPEEKKLFKEISNQNNPAKFISKLIFSDIYGQDVAKEAAIYQQFGGTLWNSKRDFIHILFHGDPSTAKTDIGLRAISINPVHRFSTGPGISNVGLTATAVRDQENGQFYAKGGLLPRYNKGTVMIDELEKMKDDDKIGLHTAMESGVAPLDKAGISGRLVANTAILATSNPKVVRSGGKVERGGGKVVNDYQKMVSDINDIDLASSILSRFDLIFRFYDVPNYQKDIKICQKIINRATFSESDTTFDHFTTTFQWNDTTYSLYSLHKFLYKAKQIQPKLSRRFIPNIEIWYAELRKQANDIGFDQKKPDPRIIEGITRLSRAIARSKLKDVVTKHEFKLANEIYNFVYDVDTPPKIIEVN